MASELFHRDDESDNVGETRRRQSLHHSCSKKTLLTAAATAFLVCLSPAVASSRHIPPTRSVSGTRPSKVRSFLSPRKRVNSQRPIVPPSTAAASTSSSSSSSLSFSASSGEESEIPPLNNNNNTTLSSSSTYGVSNVDEDDETSVTTTSFFKFPSETTGAQEPQVLTPTRGQKTIARPTQAHVQRAFVVSLMGLAGFVEGYCIRRHGCFPNLMTGTILKVAEAIGSWNFSMAGMHASMIACYMGGGYIFSKWKANNNTPGNNSNNKAAQTKSSLGAISVLSGLFLLLSDLLGGIPFLQTFRLPLLALGFGIINAGTVDVGAGVTYALTGHVTKVGQGMATGGLAKPKDPSKTSAHRTSIQGLAVFSMAALISNLVCGVVETQRAPALLKAVLEKLPIGTIMLMAYSSVFRWYLKASEKVSLLEEQKSS